MQFQVMQQEFEQLNQQSEMIEQNIKDMSELKESVEELHKKTTTEMLVNIGKKIYVPVEIKSKELVMEVGNNTFVKKDCMDVISLIDEQIGKLIVARGQMSERMQEIEQELEGAMEQQGHGCHNHNCQCEEKCDDCECENSDIDEDLDEEE